MHVVPGIHRLACSCCTRDRAPMQERSLHRQCRALHDIPYTVSSTWPCLPLALQLSLNCMLRCAAAPLVIVAKEGEDSLARCVHRPCCSCLFPCCSALRIQRRTRRLLPCATPRGMQGGRAQPHEDPGAITSAREELVLAGTNLHSFGLGEGGRAQVEPIG